MQRDTARARYTHQRDVAARAKSSGRMPARFKDPAASKELLNRTGAALVKPPSRRARDPYSELNELVNVSKEAAAFRNRGHSLPLAHNPDDVCGPDLPCCPGAHCNVHAGHCMGPPGAHGRTCDTPMAMDAASIFANTSALAAASNLSEGKVAVARRVRTELALFSARWAKSFVREKTTGKPSAIRGHVPGWGGCFGSPSMLGKTEEEKRAALRAGACNGRGECLLGLCHCRDGAFGVDCAEGPGGARWPAPNGLAVYVYGHSTACVAQHSIA